ncbi:anthranilate synthase component I family protein [Chitinophaga silvatica]|uniref:Anthranilate synthase component I family protein n=1 Tax=Chitinophaga silvatica TaxID=2282649 RepID=A0A3E1YD97_9BACT|nr:anthranilate synthase component I family protein [Chitinophaga silvatica]RFS24491.1 anthranilate synthase component I family protein [Chitinophaga silvatica]
MLNWANQFNICCFLDNNNYSSHWHQYEAILAFNALDAISAPAGNAFQALQTFHDANPDWIFGHLAYDLKNEVAPLQSQHPDGIGFPDLFFFRPEIIFLLRNTTVEIGGINLTANAAEQLYNDCCNFISDSQPISDSPLPPVQSRLPKQDYLDAVKALRLHIQQGDCYEVNFCRENFIENANVYPPALFRQLNNISPAPFAAYYRLNDRYMACSSPERYLQKKGTTVISQPIKGTSRKDPDPEIDRALQLELFNNPKERSENVMVVDLVRNDLSHTAVQGSVEVSELFGIYGFAHVHHMISTVRSVVDPATPFAEILKTTFPMGSMTGAPKLRVMELIETYERSKRGLYSGALGYITPEGDFDFNVVIRSILYNESSRYLSFQTGSAITFYCDPEKEWEECMLKAAALEKVLIG